MSRIGATRSLLRSLASPKSCHSRTIRIAASKNVLLISSVRALSSQYTRSLALSPYQPTTAALQRFASTSTGPPYGPTRGSVGDKIDHKEEHRILDSKIEPDPEHVSADSSTVPVFEGRQEKDDAPMLAGVYQDIVSRYTMLYAEPVRRDRMLMSRTGI